MTKTIRLKKKEVFSKLNSLNKESKETLKSLHKTNRDTVNVLKKIKERIVKNLDKTISLYTGKIDKLIDKELTTKPKEIKEEIEKMENRMRYIELEDFLCEFNFGKLRKTERKKADKLKKTLAVDSAYTHLFNYMRVVEMTSKGVLCSINDIVFKGLQKMEEVKTQTYVNISRTIDKHSRDYFTLPTQARTQSPMIENSNAFVDIIDSGINGLRGGTILIEKDKSFKFNLNGLRSIGEQVSSKNDKPSLERNKELFGNTKMGNKIKLDNSNIKNIALGQTLIQLDEIELDESYFSEFEESEDMEGIVTMEEEILNNFSESKEKLVELLKITLDRLNDDKFFNKNYKTDVNNYLTHFRERGQETVRNILVNFNKL